MKPTQNTQLNKIDPITNPNTLTILDRYLLASHWCKNKLVADYACGYGHGTGILHSLGARYVVGFDFEKSTIDENKRRYDVNEKKDNSVYFEHKDVTKPSLERYDDFFDTIISIETFEHIPRDNVNQYLNNIKKMLKKGGRAIITTPIRKTDKFVYQKGSTHLYEYNLNEFLEEISKVFPKFKLDSLVEFRSVPNGLLHTELINGVQPVSRLFWCEVINE